MPKLFYKNKPYTGEAVYINGYNGYTSHKDDGLLCIIVGNSAWNNKGKPNALKDENGNVVRSHDMRGEYIFIK